jgi:hypothetical protein
MTTPRNLTAQIMTVTSELQHASETWWQLIVDDKPIEELNTARLRVQECRIKLENLNKELEQCLVMIQTRFHYVRAWCLANPDID